MSDDAVPPSEAASAADYTPIPSPSFSASKVTINVPSSTQPLLRHASDESVAAIDGVSTFRTKFELCTRDQSPACFQVLSYAMLLLFHLLLLLLDLISKCM